MVVYLSVDKAKKPKS